MQSLLRPGGTDIPLKDRILRAPGGLSLPLVSLQNRPEKYKQWTDSRMEKACEAVQSGGLTVRRAAEQYFVPKWTLQTMCLEGCRQEQTVAPQDTSQTKRRWNL